MDVPLDEELRFVRRYLDIERVRLGERLDVTIEVPPEAGKALVPNLILQPLVENALKHSIAARAEGGKVRISATRSGDTLRIAVHDDGPGLPAGFSLDTTSGIGLRNLRERLEAFFGHNGMLTVAAHSTGGTLAVVEIPFASAGPMAIQPGVQAKAG